MEELLYFSFSDLLVRVRYSKEMNSLKYSSHREMSFGERVVVEQYILSTIAIKTEYYDRYPALFIYLGEDLELVQILDRFHLRQTLALSMESFKMNEEVKLAINNLIAKSMSNYYFDKIGDEIMELRKAVNNRLDDKTIIRILCKINQLISPYNKYSGDKVNLLKVIPVDLKKTLKI